MVWGGKLGYGGAMTQMQQFDGTEHITMYHEPERTSIAAILGLVCSCIGCCFGVTAIIGVFLSVFGIVGISRSKGRVGGMGFAIAGLLVGILMLVLWGAALATTSYGFKWVETNAAAPAVAVLEDIEAGNFDAARAALGSPAADVSDEVLIEFRDGYLAAVGPVVSETHGVMALFEGYSVVGEQIQNYNGRPNHIPFPVEFDQGMALVVIEINPNPNNNGSFNAVRMYVVDVDGNEFALPPHSWKPEQAIDPAVDPAVDPAEDLSGVEVEDFSDETDEDVDEGP